MPRRALLVGIDRYDNMNDLGLCVRDVEKLRPLLERHQQHKYPNYHVRTLTSDRTEVTRARLRQACEELFAFDDTVLFYFSGHGVQPRDGRDGWLVTQDGDAGAPGLALYDLLTMANRSPATSVLLILDSCFSGELGRPPDSSERYVQIDEGVTILGASRRHESALEDSASGHGVFTRLLLEGLEGAAADIRGRVHAAALYAHISGGLGPWHQRPVFKSNVTSLRTIRRFDPALEDAELQRLPEIFAQADTRLTLDGDLGPLLERLRDARLAVFECDENGGPPAAVALTACGRSYWNRARHSQA